ncbi:MAG: T9SS type A sorting domain-containing protein [Bacteroidales bacterium]|nr:T9SS type A sorting domain-containing protein [Bacteroidales bacterium]
MRKNLFSLMSAILLPLGMMAQTVTLTFTGKDANYNRVQLDHVAITNLTKGWQETLYWPDTTLTMQNGTGIHDVETGRAPSLQLSQNNPNPFNGTTDVLLTVADAGMVVLEITDANGRIVGTHRVRPQLGAHLFRVTLSAAGTYVMTARQNGKTSSIKMVNNGGGDGDEVEYVGIVETWCTAPLQPKSGTRGNTNHPVQFR